MGVEFCQKLSLHWDDHMVVIFQFFNTVYHIDWFAYIEVSLHSRDKAHLITMLSLLFSHCCATLCDVVICSTPPFPVLYISNFAQTHVHWVGCAIQPSHPLLPLSPPALNLTQHQHLFPMSWLFTSVGQSTEASASESVLPVNIQSSFRIDWFELLAV